MFGQYNGISFGQWWGDVDGSSGPAVSRFRRGLRLIRYSLNLRQRV